MSLMLYINNYHFDILTRNVPCPQRLNIELTTECNLNCIMCRGGRDFKKIHDNHRHLTVDEFIKLLNGVDLNRLKLVNLAGNSEPLLNPDILPIISTCRRHGIVIEMITNGMLLTPDVSKALLGCTNEVHISFAGATQETFESIRHRADFSSICANIRALVQLKNDYFQEFPKVWINPILMKRNIHEAPAMIMLAKKLGCDGVAFSHLTVNTRELMNESLFFHKEECNRYLTKAKEIAEANSLCMIAPQLFSLSSELDQEALDPTQAWTVCRFLWNQALLGIETIVPCSSNLPIDFDGNVINNRFMDIWNNDWFAQMRYKLLTGTPPAQCRDCKDPSVKNVNHAGSYFTEDLLPGALATAERMKTAPCMKTES